MMRKASKIGGAIMACILMLGTMSACGTGPKPVDNGGLTSTVDVWSTYATAKVTKNVKADVPYAKLDASINIQMMQNETEGTQLIVTAGDETIKSYDLATADLTDGNGHSISKNAISVYHQKYLMVAKKADLLNTNYVAGDYVPDMLLPLEIATEYGENTIAAGQNQGITIEVTTASDTVPGTYTGTFVLDLDGEKQNIPVSVEVWDIAYEGKREFQSSFLLYQNILLGGEYEASDELVERYIDFLLDYNVNVYVIKDPYTLEDEIDQMVELYENENYNSFCIPRIMQAGYTSTGMMANDIIEYIVEVAKISTPEKPYVECLYIYPTYFDEADMFADKQSDAEKVFKAGGEWDKTLERAVAAVKATEEYKTADADFQALLEDAVANIPAIFTNTTFRGDWVASMHVTFCPYLSVFGNDSQLQQYQEGAELNNNGELWAYTCVGPNYPNPTFHIDDYNLGTRVTGWMAKKFNLTGYLYWSVAAYQAMNEDYWRDIDVYETAERAGYCGGDGFLMYPGTYYGSEYPFASVRLAAWRDAMDDYDMLSVYEELLNEKADEYGITINFDDYVNDLYDSLFFGSSYYTDDALVVAARAELAERILALQSDDGIIIHPEQGKITIYSAQSALTIDGSKQSGTTAGNGYSYTVSNTGTEAKTVEIITDNGSYTYGVNAAGIIAAFTESSTNVTASEQSTATCSDGKADVKIVPVCFSEDGTIDSMTRLFTPYVQFGVNGISGASAICFTIKNTGEENIDFTLYLVNGSMDMEYEAGTGYVKSGGQCDFRIDLNRNTFTDDILTKITGVRIAFDNIEINAQGVTVLASEKEFLISDVWYEIN